MKTKLLMAVAMLLALSVYGFAQASFTVSSSPTYAASCCGETENAGQISFYPRPGSLDTIAGTITVTSAVKTYVGTQHVQTSGNDIHAFACP